MNHLQGVLFTLFLPLAINIACITFRVGAFEYVGMHDLDNELTIPISLVYILMTKNKYRQAK